jgi:hypothetical protein
LIADFLARKKAWHSLEETMSFDPDEVQRALREAWSLSTASQWTPDNPAAGQCNVTALIIHDLFGGDLLKTPLPVGDHFYNRIGGCRYDFTASQFDQPIAYTDLPTSRADAELGATNDELAELGAAFQRHRAKSGQGQTKRNHEWDESVGASVAASPQPKPLR